jgi:hypothetical protein
MFPQQVIRDERRGHVKIHALSCNDPTHMVEAELTCTMSFGSLHAPHSTLGTPPRAMSRMWYMDAYIVKPSREIVLLPQPRVPDDPTPIYGELRTLTPAQRQAVPGVFTLRTTPMSDSGTSLQFEDLSSSVVQEQVIVTIYPSARSQSSLPEDMGFVATVHEMLGEDMVPLALFASEGLGKDWAYLSLRGTSANMVPFGCTSSGATYHVVDDYSGGDRVELRMGLVIGARVPTDARLKELVVSVMGHPITVPIRIMPKIVDGQQIRVLSQTVLDARQPGGESFVVDPGTCWALPPDEEMVEDAMEEDVVEEEPPQQNEAMEPSMGGGEEEEEGGDDMEGVEEGGVKSYFLHTCPCRCSSLEDVPSPASYTREDLEALLQVGVAPPPFPLEYPL